jgi:hypothetical protein
MKIVLCAAALLLLVGCANPRELFRLEDRGEGWRLEVTEQEGRTFQARWVPGEHTSSKLVNYYRSERGGFTIINTLFLEIAPGGRVERGWLKRVAVPDMTRAAYYESGAQWFRVLAGECVLDDMHRGHVDVLCEGNFAFQGRVEPLEGLKVRRPE